MPSSGVLFATFGGGVHATVDGNFSRPPGAPHGTAAAASF